MRLSPAGAVGAVTSLLDGLLGRRPAGPAIASAVPGLPPVSYGELAAHSAHIARELLVGRSTLDGARVALLLPAGPTFVATLLGIWRAGGVAVPLSPTHTPPELAHILTTAGPEATVLDPALASHADAVGHLAGRRIEGSVFSGPGRLGDGIAAAPDFPTSDRRDQDPALMLFTSGTTGKPKGVLLSHAGVAATLSSLHGAWRWQEDDILLHALPLYHTHGLVVALLGALWAGAQVRFTSFAAVEAWDGFGDATVFMAVPTMYVRLMEAFAAAPAERRAGWSAVARRLRLFTSGSAALPASLLQAFAEATGQTILERYGMTEIGMALGNPYQGPRVAGSVGVPLPGVEVDIVHDQQESVGAKSQEDAGVDDGPVPDGQPGELRVRSAQLFLGYHDDPVATAAAYDRAGRFRTGDTGVRGPDGFIRLLGRTSVDILKTGGYKLSALEIEEVLRGHPSVADVAVIGTPDPTWGDCVTACVVLRAGAAVPTLEQLQTFARGALAPYKLPRALRLLSALPRNPMGKVQKGLLK